MIPCDCPQCFLSNVRGDPDEDKRIKRVAHVRYL
jgi:hypothetical protein